MQKVHKGLRLHIGIFGRRNVGKSSLLNALTRQAVSIVSEVAGTTTDPVEKPMEMLPVGPVLFIDTAGIDDVGALGRERVQKSRKIIERTDVGLIIATGDDWSDFEKDLLTQFQQLKIPAIVVFNKTDLAQPDPALLADLAQQKVPIVNTIADKGQGILALRQALIESVPQEFINPPAILTDLVPPGELVLFVIPIDIEAPKGRLLLPQVQAMREVLDHNAYCIVVKEHQLASALARLNKPPALVVTDSQAFEKVDKITPPQVPLTSFSILFARFKGDLDEFARGTAAIENLQPHQKILVCESCTHHP
ncbi:MAG: [FeFe] hydrogenase H-cluster maturation GTPase HydF, partial [Sedimentisphaerales bacterium]|nr:[FeFe] hydrogenase H-cluster maturation GTPase HydF [Sedimentisphaerales bacterium]